MRCKCCGGATRAAFEISDINQQVSDRLFHYGKCLRCGSYQLEDPPEDLSRYYPASYYDDMDEALSESNAVNARGQLATFSPFVHGGRIIEIGPAEGSLLQQAALAGFGDRAAVERDARCCEMLRSDGVEVAETDDPVTGLRGLVPADAVVMFHLIEHVPDPMALLDEAVAKVRAGGVLVVATPNPNALSFKVCRRWWVHVEAPRHLFLLPLQVIADRVREGGLEQVRVTTTDPVGLICDSVAWTAWAHHVAGGRGGYYLRNAVRAMARPIERRGMLGSTYTAVFQRR